MLCFVNLVNFVVIGHFAVTIHFVVILVTRRNKLQFLFLRCWSCRGTCLQS
jgi:hypothetical protein